MSNVTELLKANAHKPRTGPRFSGYGVDSTVGLQKLLYSLPHLGKVCEIGSCKGISTECLALMCDHVIAVDNWREYFECWPLFAESMKEHRNMSVLHMASEAAAALFAPEVFDLVYIDADHSYASICNDITAWLPKVRKGGWIAGHDYASQEEGVIRAVNELLGQFGKPKVFDDTSWLIHKKSQQDMGGSS